MGYDPIKIILPVLQAFLGHEITYDDAANYIGNLFIKNGFERPKKEDVLKVLNQLTSYQCGLFQAVCLIDKLKEPAAPAPEPAEKDTSVKVLNVWAVFTSGGDILFGTIAHSETESWVLYYKAASKFTSPTAFVAKQIDLSVTVK